MCGVTNTKRPDAARGIDHNRLPTGTVAGVPIRGTFAALPLFGYVSLRNRTNIPLVMLTVLLLKGDEEGGEASLRPRGTLNIEFPIYPETMDATVNMLDKLGWDGRVWPNDEGWPTGDATVEPEVIALMESAKLRATMTFPPSPQGNATMPVNVERAQGPFLMPPLTEPEGPVNAEKKDKLRLLCENPRLFHRPVRPLIFKP